MADKKMHCVDQSALEEGGETKGTEPSPSLIIFNGAFAL